MIVWVQTLLTQPSAVPQSPSSQSAGPRQQPAIGVWAHWCVLGSHVSIVQGFPSSQSPTTVTWKVQEAVFCAASVAVQVTVVVPAGKNDPEGKTQATVTELQSSAPGTV
jgi:hypothetical protein